MNNLDFRRQFILAPKLLPEFSSWKSYSVAENHNLYVHPELPCIQVTRGHLQLTLIGFMLDLDHPEKNDTDILSQVADHSKSLEDPPVLTENLGGRWAVIAYDGTDMNVFNDCCGLREVFYTDQTIDDFWCASQPSRIASYLDLNLDPGGAEFMESRFFREDPEPWWPGRATAYTAIKHLLPNFVLSQRTRSETRFWPTKKLPSLSQDEGAIKSAEYLKKVVLSAANRFKLALPITAGRDSRTILAATKGIPDIYYYSMKYAHFNMVSRDIRVPRKLLKKLNLSHHIIDCPAKMGSEFSTLYKKNVDTTHEMCGAIAQGLMHHYPQDRVMLSGHCSEIARCGVYEFTPHPDDVDLSYLAKSVYMEPSEYVNGHFSEWLSEAQPVADKFGYPVLDLFYWEQVMPNWTANGQSEWDVVMERVTPFNHRPLLETLLAVDVKYRKDPEYFLYSEIMSVLWKDVLSVPFNPEPLIKRGQIHSFFIHLLQKTGTFNIARKLYHWLRSLHPQAKDG